MEKKEKAKETYTILEESHGALGYPRFEDSLLRDVQSGKRSITDISDEEVQLLKFCQESKHQHSNASEAKDSKELEILLFRLGALRFEGLPTVKQLNDYYRKDPISYALVLFSGITCNLDSLMNGRSRVDTAYRLKGEGVLDESDILALARSKEFCEHVCGGEYDVSIPSDWVYSWNLAYIKIIQYGFSWKVIDSHGM